MLSKPLETMILYYDVNLIVKNRDWNLCLQTLHIKSEMLLKLQYEGQLILAGGYF